MAMKRVYHTVNGQMIAEETPAGGRVDYLTDALGSVTATVNQSAQVVNTYRYRPYGGLLAKTGAGSDPAFQWVGAEGYRQTGKNYSDVYIRARHYSTATTRWTTQDPIRELASLALPTQLPAYDYAGANPLVYVDPTGLANENKCKHTHHQDIKNEAVSLCHCIKDCWHDLRGLEFGNAVNTLRPFFDHAFPKGVPRNNRRRNILFWALVCVVPQESRCDPSVQLSHWAGAKGWYQITDQTWEGAFNSTRWLDRSVQQQRCHRGLNTQVAVVIAWLGSQGTIYGAVNPWVAVGSPIWRSCFLNHYNVNDIPRKYRERPEEWLKTLQCPNRRSSL